MKAQIILLAFSAIAILSSGCGSGSSTSAATSSASISGNAMFGPVKGATVTAYPVLASGALDTSQTLGSAITDTNGNYTLTASNLPSGPVGIQLSGGSYQEEASGATVNLADKTFTTVLPSVSSGATVGAAVGPLPDMAYQAFEAQAKAGLSAGTSLSQAATNANYQVSQAFGLPDVVGTLPANTTSTIPNDATGQYALVIAAISKAAETAGTDSTALAAAYAASFVQTGNFSSVANSVSVQNAAGQTVTITPPSMASLSTTVSQIGSGSVVLAEMPTPSSYTMPVFNPNPPSTAPSTYVPGSGGSTSVVTKTWTTVDLVQPSTGQSATAHGIAASTAGVIAVGYDGSNWLTRLSTDGGSTWNTLESYDPSGALSIAEGACIDSTGKVYVVGYSSVSSDPDWLVRMSSGGSSFSTIDSFTQGTGGSGPDFNEASAVSVDGSGNVFVAGYSYNPSDSVTHWIVRKSTGGGSFATVDDVSLTGGSEGQAEGITLSGGNIYVVGMARDSSSVLHGIIRKSSDAGSTWSTVSDINNTMESAIAADSNGVLYAAETDYPQPSGSPFYRQWVIRKSVDAGTTWTADDTYTITSSEGAGPSGIAVDTSGNVYTAGNYEDASNVWHWLVRAKLNGTWSTIDDFVQSGATSTEATSIASDPYGNVFAAGFASVGSTNVWLVRKYAP